MKIAIDISQIVYTGTGVANYTANLVKCLLTEDKENEYLLFGLSLRQFNLLKEFYQELKIGHNNISAKFFPIPQSLANIIWNDLHRVNIESLLGKIDIFHSSDWVQPPAQARKITTVHDLIVYKYPETSNHYIINTQKKRLHWVKKECDMIIANSYSTKSDLINILNIDGHKVEVCYPGIDDDFKNVDSSQVKRVKNKYGLHKNYILTLGTMEPRKNLNRIVASFQKFINYCRTSDRIELPELVLVGKIGWGKQITPTNSVRILGYIERKDLPALYCGATIFIYASLYEGFGLPVLEAMASGCPVISSDRGSLKEVINDNAIIVNPESVDDIAIKMHNLFMDQNLRSQLIKKSKVNAAKFSLSNQAKSILGLYEKLLS